MYNFIHEKQYLLKDTYFNDLKSILKYAAIDIINEYLVKLILSVG